jgi:capsular polysaccharide biosynthesis protein
MPAPVQSPALAVSQKLYEHLLKAYPQAHRKAYGSAMAQLFRDQCRDAWQEARSWGLIKLWLHVLPDLLKTSIAEHLHNLKGRKPMLEKTFAMFHLNTAPLKTLFSVFVIVVVLVFSVVTIGTLLMPDSYASTVRIKLEAKNILAKKPDGSPVIVSGYDPYLMQTEFEAIQSDAVLNRVIDALNLKEIWGQKYAHKAELASAETLALLRNRLELRPVRNTSLVEIRVFSEDRIEAARIANAIAEVYRADRPKMAAESMQIEILDRAEPGLRPVRPNKPLNLALGVSGGCF